MSVEPQSLRDCYGTAEKLRIRLENSPSSNDPNFQDELATAISNYVSCLSIVEQISLFSTNEGLDEVSSADLKFFLIHPRIAALLLRSSRGQRKDILLESRTHVESFLALLEQYGTLSKDEERLLEDYRDNKDGFTLLIGSDAARRRDVKIQRFKQEKTLEKRIELLSSRLDSQEEADEHIREFHLATIAFASHQAFQSLESISQELQVLAFAASEPHEREREAQDGRERTLSRETYSERLDGPLSSLLARGKAGPVLDKDGRPLRPFTLLDNRQRLRQGVFKPDHNLPSMTIDEYLEEERKRGGIIEGGGEQSYQRELVDEDDIAKADEATMKARHWDDFKEDNPRGSGNTMNMG